MVTPATPPAALTPLPTTAQVQGSVSRGRVDPFAPLTGASAGSAASVGGGESTTAAASTGLSLQGVLAVGGQVQALVRTASGSGPVCLGQAGRCKGHQDSLAAQGMVCAVDRPSERLSYLCGGWQDSTPGVFGGAQGLNTGLHQPGNVVGGRFRIDPAHHLLATLAGLWPDRDDLGGCQQRAPVGPKAGLQ